MRQPSVDDLLAGVVAALEGVVAPALADEHARSTCRTAVQLLRSARVRVTREPVLLAEDNADLRMLLAQCLAEHAGKLGPERCARLKAAVGHEAPAGPPAPEDLAAEADVLRAALVDVIAAFPEGSAPARVAVREHLARSLARQSPWLVEAFTGPRR